MLMKMLAAVGTYVLLKDRLIPLAAIVWEKYDRTLDKVGHKLADTSRQVGNVLRKQKK